MLIIIYKRESSRAQFFKNRFHLISTFYLANDCMICGSMGVSIKADKCYQEHPVSVSEYNRTYIVAIARFWFLVIRAASNHPRDIFLISKDIW